MAKDVIDRISARTKSGTSIYSRRKSAKVTNLDDLLVAELEYAKTYSAILKATGHSWRYISDTLNIQTGLVKAWADDENWQAIVAKVSSDIVDGGVTLLNNATVDLVEMLLDLARRTTDDSVKLRAIESGLDRVGVTKINKSESKVTRSDRVETDLSPGFFDRFEALPLESQRKMAELMSEAEKVFEEARGTE